MQSLFPVYAWDAKLGDLICSVEQLSASNQHLARGIEIRNLPRMTTITTKKHPITRLYLSCGAQITGHVSWGLYNPEAPVPEIIHCFLEWAEWNPGSI
jgi:hypothetical protein